MKNFIWKVSLVFFALSSVALADELLLKNGERLIGKITGAADGKLKISSISAGDLTVAIENVKTFSTDEPISLVFKDGTVLNKKAKSSDEGKIAIEDGVVKAQSYSITDIDKINPPPVQWTGSISAGFAISRGNSSTENASVDVFAVRKSDEDRITAKAGYIGNRQEDPTTGVDTTTKRMVYGSMQYDYFFSKKLYGYANARAEKDAIALLDLRFTSGIGLGYQILDEETMKLSGEAGVSWLSESYDGPTPSNDTMTGRLAFRFTKDFDKSVKFFSDGEWYESFEGYKDQYANATVGLRSSLTKSMFAEMKVIWMWDSTPAIGKEREDVSYIAGIGWSF